MVVNNSRDNRHAFGGRPPPARPLARCNEEMLRRVPHPHARRRAPPPFALALPSPASHHRRRGRKGKKGRGREVSAPPRQEPPPPTAARRRRSEWGRGRGDRKEGGAESAGLDREGRGGGKVKGKGAGGSAGGEGCGRIQKVGVGGEIDREFRNSRLTVDSASRNKLLSRIFLRFIHFGRSHTKLQMEMKIGRELTN